MNTTVLRRASQSHYNNPAPGQPGHDHWGDRRKDHGVSQAIWQAYGDRYPGSRCRALQTAQDGLDARSWWSRPDRQGHCVNCGWDENGASA